MQKIFVFLCASILSITAHSQTYSVKWGEEMKIKKGSVDFDVINADETGVYLLEGKMKMTSYFVIGYTLGSTHKLMKFDRNYNPVYEQEYKKELKGLNFKSIQFLKNEMYLFADDYIKKEKKYIIYGVKVNRNTGETLGEMKELASFELESKKDDFEYSFTPNPDSTKWLLVGNVSTENTTSLSIVTLDKDLSLKSKANINLAFDPKTFMLEDLLPTADNKFVLLGRKYDMVPTGKKNKTTLAFTGYIFSRYDAKGKKEMDFPIDANAHYVMSGKAILLPGGELTMAGFYSNDVKKREVDGFFIHRLDINSGAIVQSSFKEISASMLDQASINENDMDDENQKEKKQREKAKDKDGDDDGLSKDFVIRGVELNPATGSVLLIAEMTKFSVSTRTYYDNYSKSWKNTTTYTFTNSDLLVVNTSRDGRIQWINTLPKKQIESVQSANYSGETSSYGGITGYFARGGGMPFYSSIGYMVRNDKLIFLMNDHALNSNTKKLGDKVQAVYNFKKSVSYAVSMDLNTGQFSRKPLLSNEDDPVLMPRFAFVVGNDFYLPAMKMKGLGKTEFKVGKITVRL